MTRGFSLSMSLGCAEPLRSPIKSGHLGSDSHWHCYSPKFKWVIRNDSSLSPSSRLKMTLGIKSLLTWFPLGLAESASLQGLNHAKCFFGRTSDVQVVDNLVTQNSLRIDHKQS